jgi:hypothetical protein
MILTLPSKVGSLSYVDGRAPYQGIISGIRRILTLGLVTSALKVHIIIPRVQYFSCLVTGMGTTVTCFLAIE